MSNAGNGGTIGGTGTGTGTETGKSGDYGQRKLHAVETGAATTRTGDKRSRKRATAGVSVERYFTKLGENPFDTVEWEIRKALIANENGDVVFEQDDCEIPKAWSQLATNVVVSKYFRGHIGTPERERSVKQLIGRVVERIRSWGAEAGYFKRPADASAFADELTHLLVNQKVAFNSPVWFNLGVEGTPQQASACFINSVEDTMDSIMDLAKTEAMLFKGGSGSGTNLSKVRSSRETLAGGGVASGPVSFMKGFDAFAGVIKSGGKTRRAAKMVILNADHPDIREFVNSKSGEEKKAWSLIDAGYDGGFNVPGGAYDSISFQNANHSVRVTDGFMQAAESNAGWSTKAVTTGEVVESFPARDLLAEMAEAAHVCGDPGIQYDSNINRWNPVKASGRINSSNPCSEYMFLDDTACNLASLNLMTFVDEQGEFQVEDFRRAVATSTGSRSGWAATCSCWSASSCWAASSGTRCERSLFTGQGRSSRTRDRSKAPSPMTQAPAHRRKSAARRSGHGSRRPHRHERQQENPEHGGDDAVHAVLSRYRQHHEERRLQRHPSVHG